jgi:hypothetical protein
MSFVTPKITATANRQPPPNPGQCLGVQPWAAPVQRAGDAIISAKCSACGATSEVMVDRIPAGDFGQSCRPCKARTTHSLVRVLVPATGRAGHHHPRFMELLPDAAPIVAAEGSASLLSKLEPDEAA